MLRIAVHQIRIYISTLQNKVTCKGAPFPLETHGSTRIAICSNLCLWLCKLLQNKNEVKAVQCQSRHYTELSLGLDTLINMHSWLLCYCNVPLRMAVLQFFVAISNYSPHIFDKGIYLSRCWCSIRKMALPYISADGICRKQTMNTWSHQMCLIFVSWWLINGHHFVTDNHQSDGALCCIRSLVPLCHWSWCVFVLIEACGCVRSSLGGVLCWLVSPVGCCFPSPRRRGVDGVS